MDLVPVELKVGIFNPRGIDGSRLAFGFGSVGCLAKGAGPRSNLEHSVEVG